MLGHDFDDMRFVVIDMLLCSWMFVIAGRVLDAPSRHLSGAIVRNLRTIARKIFRLFLRGDFVRERRVFAGCRKPPEQAFMRFQCRGLREGRKYS